MRLRCFWCEPTGEVVPYIHMQCPVDHANRVELPSLHGVDLRDAAQLAQARVDWETAPWPACCAECGRRLLREDPNVFAHSGSELIYRRVDTGEEIRSIQQAPPGAMYDTYWRGPRTPTYDGRAVTVILPGGTPWFVDGRASNCTDPDRPHHCWVRHGEPPNFTVNSEPQSETCDAGGGSIWEGGIGSSSFHGFLTNGWLLEVGEEP